MKRHTITKKQYDYLLPVFGLASGNHKIHHYVDRKHDKYYFWGTDEEFKDMLNRCAYLD